MVLIFILEIAGGIYAATKKDAVIESMQKNFQEIIDNSYEQTSEADKGLTKSVDWFQTNVCKTTTESCKNYLIYVIFYK